MTIKTKKIIVGAAIAGLISGSSLFAGEGKEKEKGKEECTECCPVKGKDSDKECKDGKEGEKAEGGEKGKASCGGKNGCPGKK